MSRSRYDNSLNFVKEVSHGLFPVFLGFHWCNQGVVEGLVVNHVNGIREYSYWVSCLHGWSHSAVEIHLHLTLEWHLVFEAVWITVYTTTDVNIHRVIRLKTESSVRLLSINSKGVPLETLRLELLVIPLCYRFNLEITVGSLESIIALALSIWLASSVWVAIIHSSASFRYHRAIINTLGSIGMASQTRLIFSNEISEELVRDIIVVSGYKVTGLRYSKIT